MRIMLSNLQLALLGIFAILVIGTLVIKAKAMINPSALDQELGLRMRSWWVMAGAVILAVSIGQTACIVLFGIMSFLALREYFNMTLVGKSKLHFSLLTCLVIAMQYIFVWQGWYSLFQMFIPVGMLLCVPVYMVVCGESKSFLTTVAHLHWGLMLMVFLLSHAAYLVMLQETSHSVAGGVGWLLFLIFLTQFNDVLQFIWGKLLGKTKVVPNISPSKTLEGLLGGIITTVVLAWMLAPYLTSLIGWEALLAGAMIGVGGFLGDVTMSAIKREIGVKDTSNLIPGHGGILDRIDSLIFTAPLFFYFVLYTQGR
jgi:phosphatidate cytidylyltransferase